MTHTLHYLKTQKTSINLPRIRRLYSDLFLQKTFRCLLGLLLKAFTPKASQKARLHGLRLCRGLGTWQGQHHVGDDVGIHPTALGALESEPS